MKSSTAIRHAVLFGAAAFLSSLASASTIIVNSDGSGDYLTIQEGIDNAVAGDTILVADGVYYEDLIIPVSVSLVGAGMGQSIIKPATSVPGSGVGSQVTTTTWMARIQADDVTITGFTFNGDSPNFAAPIDARGGIITDYSVGNFSGIEVVNCGVRNILYRGIYLAAGGTGHRVAFCAVTNVKGMPLDSVGIFFYGAVGEAAGNVVNDCSIGVGFQAGGGGDIRDNRITNCDLGILANGSTSPVSFTDNVINTSSQGMQVIAVNTPVIVQTNSATGCGTGLTLFGLGTGNSSIDGNTFDGVAATNSYGIYASTDVSPWGFGDLTFVATNNSFVDNDIGAVLSESTDLTPVLSGTFSGAGATLNSFRGSVSYNMYLDLCDDDVAASYNDWGAGTPALIENTIHHQVDDVALGLVDFSNPVAMFFTVDDDGPADFTSINPAVQALTPGGTIQVMPGLYVEDVLIDRSCLIQGSGTDADPLVGTVLQGGTNHVDMNVVEVTGPDVFIDNLRVDGQQPTFNHARRAIYGNAVSGLNVTNCVIHTARTAVAYTTSTDGTFLGNEVYDFGVDLNNGGGIFLWNATGTVGLPGQGNWVHDGLATAIIFHNSSAGEAYDNLTANCALGFLSNGAVAHTLFEGNSSVDCTQGYQGIGNHVPVTYVDNYSEGGTWGFVLFGLGAQVHTYTGNRVHDTSEAWSITTECVYGDDDAVAILEGNTATQNVYGVVMDETVSSKSFLMDIDLNGANAANWIQGNDLQDIQLINCNDDIDARNNYLGSTDPAVIEDQITHQVDNPALGLVDFSVLQPSFVYCTGKLSSAGCVPQVGSDGVCSATSPLPFNVTAVDVVSQQFGFLFYAFNRNELPFWGGTLCLKGPLRRTPVQKSNGTGAGNCTGTYSLDMNALIQSGIYPNLDPGVSLFAQYWFRDPPLGGQYPAGLTNAITFTIAP